VLAQNGFNGCAGIPTKGLLIGSSATPRVTRVWEKTKIQEKIGKMPKNARFSKKKSSEPTPCAPGVIKVSLESPLKGLPPSKNSCLQLRPLDRESRNSHFACFFGRCSAPTPCTLCAIKHAAECPWKCLSNALSVARFGSSSRELVRHLLFSAGGCESG
jgi:hypothetical protein